MVRERRWNRKAAVNPLWSRREPAGLLTALARTPENYDRERNNEEQRAQNNCDPEQYALNATPSRENAACIRAGQAAQPRTFAL